jgi:hypothetical protein
VHLKRESGICDEAQSLRAGQTSIHKLVIHIMMGKNRIEMSFSPRTLDTHGHVRPAEYCGVTAKQEKQSE